MSKSEQKKGKASGKQEKEETVKPPRVLSSYIFFTTELIPKVKKEEAVPHREAMARAGEEWQKMSDKEKEPYVKMSQKDQER